MGTVSRENISLFRTYHWFVVTRKNILNQGCVRNSGVLLTINWVWWKKESILIVPTVLQASHRFLQHNLLIHPSLSVSKGAKRNSNGVPAQWWERCFLFCATFYLLGPEKKETPEISRGGPVQSVLKGFLPPLAAAYSFHSAFSVLKMNKLWEYHSQWFLNYIRNEIIWERKIQK